MFEYLRDTCRATGKDRFYNGCNLHNENAVRFYKAMGGRVIGWCTADGDIVMDQLIFEHPVEVAWRPASDSIRTVFKLDEIKKQDRFRPCFCGMCS